MSLNPKRTRWMWATLLVGLGMLPAVAGPVRVALMDFTALESSHRSLQSAVDFTASLQAALGATPGIEWVERERIALAAKELELAGLGFVEPSEAARAGRWAGADWALFGAFRTNASGEGRRLLLEVVDLARAVPLARTNLAVSSSVKGPLVWGTEDLSAAASLLGRWLPAVASSAAAEADRPLVALIAHAVQDASDDAELVDPELAAACAAVGARFHRLAPGPETLFESEAFLTGMTVGATNRPALPADLLLFAHTWISRRVRITAWDRGGRSSEFEFALDGRTASSAALARWLPGILREATNTSVVADRTAVARTIVARADSANLVPRVSWGLGGGGSRWNWVQGCAVLDVALQLAPEARDLREAWTRQRWSPGLATDHARPFHFRRRALAAWLDLVARHGPVALANDGGPVGDPASIRPITVILRLMEELTSDLWSDSNRAESGLPDDVGGRVAREWHRRLTASFLTSLPRMLEGSEWKAEAEPMAWLLMRTQGERPPGRAEALARVEALRRIWPEAIRTGRLDLKTAEWMLANLHERAGLKGQEESLLTPLRQVPKPEPAPVASKTNAPLRLPPLALLDEGLQDRWFAAGPPPARKVAPVSSGAVVHFPARTRVTHITGAIFHDGALWLSGITEEAAAEPESGRQDGVSLNGDAVREFRRIWRIDGAGDEVVAVPTPRSVTAYEPFRLHDGTLELEAQDQWWRWTGKEWVPSDSRKGRRPGPQGLRLWHGIVQGLSTNGIYTNVVPASPWPEVAAERPLIGLGFVEEAVIHNLVAATVIEAARILRSRPTSPVVPGPWSRHEITSFLEDGTTIWIGTGEGILAAFDRASGKYLRATRFSLPIQWIRRGAGMLWVVFTPPDQDRGPSWAAYRLDPEGLPPAPADWGQELKPAEVLTPEESASRALFSGRPQEAAESMETVPAGLRTPMGWLLLAAALEDLGPARAEHLDSARRELRSRFPGSVAEKVLTLARREAPPSLISPGPRTPEERANQAFLRLDRDGDGFIDVLEFEFDPLTAGLAPPQLQLFSGPTPTAETPEETGGLWRQVFGKLGFLIGGQRAVRLSREDLMQVFAGRPGLRPLSAQRLAPLASTNPPPSAGKVP